MIVLDASAAIAMCLDERGHPADDAAFESLGSEDLIVPAHWHAEIGNAMLINMRRGRLRSDQLAQALARLAILRVSTHTTPDVQDCAPVVEAAFRSRLTYYDELYVRLAEMKNVAIFTLDNEMRAAAKQRGVAVLPA